MNSVTFLYRGSWSFLKPICRTIVDGSASGTGLIQEEDFTVTELYTRTIGACGCAPMFFNLEGVWWLRPGLAWPGQTVIFSTQIWPSVTRQVWSVGRKRRARLNPRKRRMSAAASRNNLSWLSFLQTPLSLLGMTARWPTSSSVWSENQRRFPREQRWRH